MNMGTACCKQKKSLPIPNEFETVPLPSPPVSEEQSVESLLDGVTLLWLDKNHGAFRSEYEKDTLCYLRQLSGTSIRLYSDVSSCLAFLKSVQHDGNIERSKIFLIVSGAFSSQILSELKSFSIVESVFIFCMDRSQYIHLMKEYQSLVIGICTENQELANCLSKQLQEVNQQKLVFHFFAQEQNTTRNLTKDSASFIWFQLFQITLSELQCSKSEMNIMLNYCSKQSQHLSNRKQVLFHIEQFREKYKSADAIFWYTKESFVYRLLNAALRTEDFEALYIFRFFIADLCRQLKFEHNKLRIQQTESPILTLYRGGKMSHDELDKLKETVGSLISLNGFVSTSKQRWVAMAFLEKQVTNQSSREKVLFIIEVDIRSKDIICADVRDFSTQKEEEEFLFNMGTAFYLERTEYDSDQQITKVYMKATEDGMKAANDYVHLIHQELTNTSVSIIFGQLFLQLGNYVMAQKYFLDLLERSRDDDPDIPAIRYHLALTYSYPGKLDQAEDLLNEVYNYHISNGSDKRHLARIKNALGRVYHHSGELNLTMSCCQEALALTKNQSDLNNLINAQTYSLMGDYYLEKLILDQAEKCYEQALKNERRHLPTDHPRIGVTLNDLGNVYRKKKEMETALEYYEQAESIFRRKLPVHHPSTAYCWSSMAFVYLYEGKLDQAYKYHDQALKTYRRVLPPDHINIRISEKNSTCTDIQKINETYIKTCAEL